MLFSACVVGFLDKASNTKFVIPNVGTVKQFSVALNSFQRDRKANKCKLRSKYKMINHT